MSLRSWRPPITSTGWTVCATAAVGYAVGAALGYRLLAAIAVGLAGLVAVATAWVLIRPRVDLERTVEPDRVTVGDQALGRLEVRNRSRWPSVPFTAVDRVGADTVALAVGPLAGGGRRPMHYPIRAERRGRVVLGPLTVERSDPLGLLRRARRVAAPSVLWVHPHTHRANPLPVGIVLDYEALTTANSRIGTLTFSSLRDYVHGDDPRRIHWRTTARAGHLVVKEYIDTSEPTTTVLLDNVSISEPALFEEAVQIAASIYQSMQLAGRAINLDLVHDETIPDALTPLDLLAAVMPTPDSAGTLLERLDQLPGGGVLVVITASVAGLLPRLSEQRRRFNPVVVFDLLASTATSPEGMHRRSGMAIITTRGAADAIGRWNHLTGGEGE